MKVSIGYQEVSFSIQAINEPTKLLVSLAVYFLEISHI